MSYAIRPAQITDAFTLADLLHDIGYFTLANSETQAETSERVRRQLDLCFADDSHNVYVACMGDDPADVLGYLSVHWLPYLLHNGPEGYISELFIRQAARGQGIGGALLDTAIAEGRRRGCSRMMLLNMRSRESYLRGFYKKHGWEEREDAANFVLVLGN